MVPNVTTNQNAHRSFLTAADALPPTGRKLRFGWAGPHPLRHHRVVRIALGWPGAPLEAARRHFLTVAARRDRAILASLHDAGCTNDPDAILAWGKRWGLVAPSPKGRHLWRGVTFALDPWPLAFAVATLEMWRAAPDWNPWTWPEADLDQAWMTPDRPAAWLPRTGRYRRPPAQLLLVPEHVEWLVDYQVRGLSKYRIALDARTGANEADTQKVRSALPRLARLLGVPLRAPTRQPHNHR